jgi:hypothetical protein
VPPTVDDRLEDQHTGVGATLTVDRAQRHRVRLRDALDDCVLKPLHEQLGRIGGRDVDIEARQVDTEHVESAKAGG